MSSKQSHVRICNVRADTVDFRDKMYQATLVEVPPHINLETYRQSGAPVLDQEDEGTCTGFGLAAIANYLLRNRQVSPDRNADVSPRMFYEMAKRYDEYPGNSYEGSSARGAMKGWFKHGVCHESIWEYGRKGDRELTHDRVQDALKRPLGAYYRVNHKDLIAIHSALAEVKILYATANIHTGWEPEQIDTDGLIHQQETILGGHAFAIVAYDRRGFWIQNSWGPNWGLDGFAQITYDDWLANGLDIWVARLGVPIEYSGLATTKNIGSAQSARAYTYANLRSHIITFGNDGRLKEQGNYATSEQDIERIFTKDFEKTTDGWDKKRLLLYAHGGLVEEEDAIKQAGKYRDLFLGHQIYPVCFVWYSGLLDTLTNMAQDIFRRRQLEVDLSDLKDLVLDRLDDTLEILVRTLRTRVFWDEMKENALMATTSSKGGAGIVLNHIVKLLEKYPNAEVHLLAHSAGSIFQAPLAQLLSTKGEIANNGPLKGKTGFGKKITSCTLWAPACTTELFTQTYLPLIENKGIERFALFTLQDNAERDDNCINLYHKSLMYLVSNALEKISATTQTKDPKSSSQVSLLGMEKFIRADEVLNKLFDPKTNWVLAPTSGSKPEGSRLNSKAKGHSDFNDDNATLLATIAHIQDVGQVKTIVPIQSSLLNMSALRSTVSTELPKL